MADAKLYCTFILLLYLEENYAQQGLQNNQNVGVNNGIGLQQQALQQMNAQNNINQIPNGGLNINLPQSSLQQGNLQQPIGANLQGNLPQSLSLPANLQPQGASVQSNFQITKQGLAQLPPGFAPNQSKSQNVPNLQFNNGGAKQNVQMTQQTMGPQQQTNGQYQQQNTQLSSNSLAEIAALKGQPSLLSLFSNQNNVQGQQNQPISAQNFNIAQNQLTDAQKQYLVRSLQSQSSGQNQQGPNIIQAQLRMPGGENQPFNIVQGQPMPSQQPQVIVSPSGPNQPAFITVQAQPLPTYIQNQQPAIIVEEEPSILSLILSELQASDPQYAVYPPTYQVQKKGSKSNLKTLIPLIINLLKEKNGCGCRNCGCQNNGCGNGNQEPTIFSGYASQKNYGQGKEQSATSTNADEPKSKTNTTEQNNVKKNTVNVDSEEVSDENDSEYEDDSEGD